MSTDSELVKVFTYCTFCHNRSSGKTTTCSKCGSTMCVYHDEEERDRIYRINKEIKC